MSNDKEDKSLKLCLQGGLESAVTDLTAHNSRKAIYVIFYVDWKSEKLILQFTYSLTYLEANILLFVARLV